uniref:GLTSCR protein conserved domain-containing protein n=1 Tax=Poecilia mexicana TaxID=48701 RepID=A0A3B3WUJ2_9TELE
MDDEDGRCLLDVICDPEALNDFLHGSETHLDTDDLLDGTSDPSSSFFSATGLPVSESAGLPRVSVDLDFLEDDDILGGSPGGDGDSNGIGTNHEPCDILQQSLAEANITEQSLQEAGSELDLVSFGIPGLTQVVQTLPDAGSAAAVGSAAGNPGNATADMLGSVLAQQGLQLQPQVMNKTISVQPFMQPVGLGNVTLQPISSLQALSNGSQSGPLGIGQIQVVGQPTVMTINQSGQQILAKAMGGYQEVSTAGSQAGLGLIQGNKAAVGAPAINGPAVSVSSTSSMSAATMSAPAGLVGFGGGVAPPTQTQAQIMQNVIIQRTPTPIQPKPPQGGAIQPKVFKPQQQQPPPPQAAPQAQQNDAHKALGLQQLPVSAAQNVTFLAGKPGSNVVLSTQAATQGPQFQQALFKQQAAPPSGKPLSVHLLNQQGSIVIPSQTVLQSQNHQFLLPQLQAGGQILTQHPGGHIITSQGPGGQLIANQILTANQNINLSQVLTSQGHPGAAHILSGPIQLQPGQMGTPTLFQMPVASLAQSQSQTQTPAASGHTQTVIQGLQNPLAMTTLQAQPGAVPSAAGGQTAEAAVTVLGGSADPAPQLLSQSSILAVQPASSAAAASSSPSMSVSTSSSVTAVGLVSPQAQSSPGRLLFTNQGSSMILSQESLQMFLQQVSAPPVPSGGAQQALKIQGISSSPALTSHATTPPVAESPQPSQSPLTLSQQIQSPHHQQPPQSRPSSQPQPQTPSRSCTPSSHTQLFIVHNQIAESPKPAASAQAQLQQTPPQQVHIQVQHQPQPRPASQPTPYQQEMPPMSQSPKPLPAAAAPPAQHQFAAPPVSAPAVVKAQVPLQGLTAGQQHHLQLVGAQIQTLSSITQPSPQHKQLLEKLQQVLLLFLLQRNSNVLFFFPILNFLNVSLFAFQLTSQTPPVKMPLSTEPSKEARFAASASFRPELNRFVVGIFLTTSCKLCRMLEQLRKHQGSVLHPNYSAPFLSFDDTLNRLLPYHLYQGTANSSQDYQRVDDEFERVSCQLLKRTQAMLDKYRYLLFTESKRLGPSAEMVMIDRMFIQEEKVALNQDRILAKERPDLPSASPAASTAAPALIPSPAPLLKVAPTPPPAPAAPASPTPPPAPTPPSCSPFPPTKLVIKHAGGGASVSWSSSCPPAVPPAKPVAPAASSSSSLNSQSVADDDDALPQRTSKPPIKTYEARSRIGLKLKIKQDQTGFSKVVHNTALDPVHAPQPRSTPEPNAPPSSSTTTTQMNGSLDHHPVKHNLASSQTTCRLPLRKTYRENISPRVRPGVPGGGKNKHRTGGTFRMDQHAPGPPSPESSFARDSLLPAKRCKSDSPDMDNASFSSGSPPDDSLNEHLQCAIDSILNLQQEPAVRGHHVRAGTGGRTHQHQSQRLGDSAVSTHRAPPPTAPSAPSSSSLGPQVGGRGHNGSLVPQTQSR